MRELMRQLLWLPPQASTFAWPVDRLHYFVITVTMIASILTGLLAFYFFFKYRARRENQSTPLVLPSVKFEIAVIGVPLFFFLLWFVQGFKDYIWYTTPPKNTMDVYVMAKKWMWKFAYAGGGPNAIGTLHVPANRPVRLLMTSRDVIHSFYVPSFRIKQDVLPGRYTQTWFEANQPGRYQILCAEYCGTDHSNMRGEVVVLRPEEFDSWMADQRRGPADRADMAPTAQETVPPMTDMVEQGRRVAIQFGCLKCHSVDGTSHIGPTWLDLYHRKERLNDGRIIDVDEAYMTESMMDPRAKIVAGYSPVMPVFQGRLAGPEVAALLEFIKSLRTDRIQNPPSKGPSYEPIPG